MGKNLHRFLEQSRILARLNYRVPILPNETKNYKLRVPRTIRISFQMFSGRVSRRKISTTWWLSTMVTTRWRTTKTHRLTAWISYLNAIKRDVTRFSGRCAASRITWRSIKTTNPTCAPIAEGASLSLVTCQDTRAISSAKQGRLDCQSKNWLRHEHNLIVN